MRQIAAAVRLYDQSSNVFPLPDHVRENLHASVVAIEALDPGRVSNSQNRLQTVIKRATYVIFKGLTDMHHPDKGLDPFGGRILNLLQLLGPQFYEESLLVHRVQIVLLEAQLDAL